MLKDVSLGFPWVFQWFLDVFSNVLLQSFPPGSPKAFGTFALKPLEQKINWGLLVCSHPTVLVNRHYSFGSLFSKNWIPVKEAGNNLKVFQQRLHRSPHHPS